MASHDSQDQPGQQQPGHSGHSHEPTPRSVYLSHYHTDSDVARALANALEAANFTVRYDEHHRRAYPLSHEVQHELHTSQSFIVLLSPAALREQLIKEETTFFLPLHQQDPTRLVLPVVAATLPKAHIWPELHHLPILGSVAGEQLHPHPQEHLVELLLKALH